MSTLEAAQTFTSENEAKADFDSVYTAPTPHAYIATMAETGYEIGERARPYCCAAVDLIQEQNGLAWPTQLLDVGCSYGIGSAFVKYNCGFDELVAFFGSRAPMAYGAACEATRQWLNVTPPGYDVRCVGLDSSRQAIRFAVDAGLLDGGLAKNFEAGESPSPSNRQWFRGCNLLMSTGAIGYVTERTLDWVLADLGKSHSGSFGPIAVMTILRMFDSESIGDCFESNGYAFRQVPGVCLPQRNFASDDERRGVLEVLHDRAIDTALWEDKGKLAADLFVAAPTDSIDAVVERMVETHQQLSCDDRAPGYIQR